MMLLIQKRSKSGDINCQLKLKRMCCYLVLAVQKINTFGPRLSYSFCLETFAVGLLLSNVDIFINSFNTIYKISMR